MRAALLIDWENFAGRLAGAPYWRVDASSLVEPLVKAVRDHADNLGGSLDEMHYFLAVDKEIGTPTRTALTNAGFTRVEATNAKNGADSRLIVYATRQQALRNFELFYVMTGDEDFADLAHELRSAGASCYLCPVDSSRLRGPIQNWPNKVFVKDGFIPLPHGSPPSAATSDLFTMCLQALSDSGTHMGDWNATCSAVADRFGFGGASEVGVLLQNAKNTQILWEGPVVIDGAPRKRRRLRYETVKLARFLSAADRMLDEVKKRQDVASHGDLLNAIPAELKTEYAALPEMLVRAGYLDRVGEDSFKMLPLGDPGILRPLRRIALAVWHLGHQNPSRVGVAPGRIFGHWSRHEYPGQRDLSAEKAERANELGKQVVNRGLAAGVLLPTGRKGDATQPFGYVVQDKHPLVEEVLRVGELIWRLLPIGGASVDRIKVLDDLAQAASTTPALGTTEREHNFWLSALASEGIIYMREGRVSRGKNTPVRNLWQ